MADEEKINGACSRGADWEVVALTASAYAASPGPDGGSHNDFISKEIHEEHVPSSAMFLSEHFIFPPHEHENLPVTINSDEDDITFLPGSGFMPSDEEYQTYLYELSENRSETALANPSSEHQEDQTGCSFHPETDFRELVPSDEKKDIDRNYDMSPDLVKFGKTGDGKNDVYSLPCEVWWKRQAVSLYKKAKETNTFWPICMAAALMGLVVLGQQWRREKLQFQQLKLQLSNTNERMSNMFGSVNRFKDALVGAHHHSSAIYSSASADL